MKSFISYLDEGRGRPRKQKQSFDSKTHKQKLEQFKTDLRRMNKIYRSIDPKEDKSENRFQKQYTKDSYKRFFEAKKLFRIFSDNFEKWVFYDLLDRNTFGKSEEEWSQINVRKTAWAAFVDISPGINFPEMWAGSSTNDKYVPDLDRFIREKDKNVREWNKKFNKAFKAIDDHIREMGKEDEVPQSDENISINGVNFKIIGSGKQQSDNSVLKKYLQHEAPFAIDLLRKKGFGQVLRKLSVELDFTGKGDTAGEYSHGKNGIVKIYTWGIISSGKEARRVLIHEIAHRFYYMLLPKNVQRLWDDIIEKHTFIISQNHIKTFENLLDDNGQLIRSAFQKVDSISDPREYLALNYLVREKSIYSTRSKENVVKTAKNLVGKNTYKEYITEYAGKNGSEAFAEALSLYLLYGPRRLGPITRNLLKRVVEIGGVILKEDWDNINNIKGGTMKSFLNFINEESLDEAALKPGDWIKQTGSDWVAYALIIDKNKGGGFRVVKFTSYNGSPAGKATLGSTKGWHPEPKQIQMKDVPPKIQDKIMDKAENYL